MSKKSDIEPVDEKTLRQLTALSNKKQDLANEVLDLELNKIQLLLAAEMVTKSLKELLSSVAEARGLDPDKDDVTVDSESGEVTVQ